MYKVNGWFPNYGCSRYQVEDGDVICWVYTCDLGADVGDNSMNGRDRQMRLALEKEGDGTLALITKAPSPSLQSSFDSLNRKRMVIFRWHASLPLNA